MDEEQTGPGDIPTGKRMKHVGTAMASSIAHKLSGNKELDQKGGTYVLDEAEVEALIND